MNKTNIEWVKNPDGTQGYTWNPITGCLNHDNGLCKGGGFPCYAYKLAHGRLKQRYLANTLTSAVASPNDTAINLMQKQMKAELDPFYPRFWPKRLGEITNKLRRWGRNKIVHTHKPRGVFVCDMSDLFGIGIPEEWTGRVLDKMQYAKQDRFYLLTKQPQNLAKWSPFPDNCWVGVTATSFHAFADAHYYLSLIEAKVKYVSFEPLLFWGIGASPQPYQELSRHLKECCNWLIIGAQTKPYKPPKRGWVEEIIVASDSAGIPVFIKDNLQPILPKCHPFMDFGNRKERYLVLPRLRQEMPQ